MLSFQVLRRLALHKEEHIFMTKVFSKVSNGVLYISMCGELDESASVSVRTELDAVINRSNFDRVVIDLSKLVFMDSTGIGVLIGRYKKLRALGALVFLANPTASVDKILRLSGIYDIMPKVG